MGASEVNAQLLVSVLTDRMETVERDLWTLEVIMDRLADMGAYDGLEKQCRRGLAMLPRQYHD